MITWEADCGEKVIRSDSGASYGDIDRDHLTSFRIVDEGVVLLSYSVVLPDMFTYRRRTRMTQGGVSRVQFIVGEVGSEVMVYDVGTGITFPGWFGMEHEHADFSQPVAHPHEGEKF